MRYTVLLLALASALSPAADSAVDAPQSVAIPQSTAPDLKSPDAIAIPRMLSYQGRLTDSLGVPVPNGSYPTMFLLYTAPTGGSPFWSETQSVTTEDGLFSVLLGAVTPIDSVPGAGAAYLGMTVSGGPELTPRIRIVSSAFAYLSERAADADQLQGKDTTGFVRAGQPNSVTSAMIVNGTVGAADLGQMGASAGQVMKWTGSAWQPRNDSVGSGGGGTVTSVSQATGVVCSPNPITTSGTVRFDSTWGDARFVNEGQANSVTGAMIVDGQVASADIRDTTVNTAELKDAAVTAAKLNQMGAAASQVLKWTGSTWAPADDSAGAGDNAWVRVGSDSVLYTAHYLGIARGEAENTLYGANRFTHVNLGVQCTTGTSGQNYNYITVGGGRLNVAANYYATVAGGYGNDAGNNSATVAGGYNNDAGGSYATVGGGYNNDASSTDATVGGGNSNAATALDATVGGGYSNAASGTAATVGGGRQNAADTNYATVAGGYNNDATGYAATVGGGYGNSATNYGATVGGGYGNDVPGYGATVGGGSDNSATSTAATVGGGYNNAADTSYATVGGGHSNSAAGYAATVGGGHSNDATGYAATVGGGRINTATGYAAAVGGGRFNDATGYAATVAGGNYNVATDSFATVAGGYADTSASKWSFTTGRNSVVPVSFTNSAAFNGQTATGANQTRVGALSKASGTFTIDHPLDPYGKILNHYFIEGPEMLNIYRGSTVLNAAGRAEVRLPDYFDALNRDPMVQLTGVGTSAVIYVAEDVSSNRFTIGGPAGTKVYWQVTGERRDVSAEATRRMMPVEQPKTGPLAGRMLDDEFIAGCMEQLVREGKASGIDFRTAAGRRRYERLEQRLPEPGQE